jgi:hypothetical protein
MALCFEDLARPQEALAEYVAALRLGGADIPAEQRGQMELRTVALRTELGVGHIGVLSTPAGAQVSIDGAVIGATPFDGDVAAGSHALVVEIPGEWRAERPLVVRAGETRVLELELTRVEAPPMGTLRVESEPPGAVVLLDGRRIGTTPLLTADVPAGEHLLRIEDDRGASWEERITVGDGSEVRVRAAMPSAGVHQGWFWGVAATAAVLGITGAATGGYGIALHDTYDDTSKNLADRMDAGELGETMHDVADGMFIAAGAAAIGALVLGFFTDFGGGAGQAEAVIDLAPMGAGASDE